MGTTVGVIDDLPVPRTRGGFRSQLFARYQQRMAEVDDLIQQTNRLHDTSDPDVRGSLETLLATIDSQLTSIQQQINAHLLAQLGMREHHDLIDAVPGIGPMTAQKLVAEFYDLASYPSAKAVGADAGLTPATVRHWTLCARVRAPQRVPVRLGRHNGMVPFTTF